MKIRNAAIILSAFVSIAAFAEPKVIEGANTVVAALSDCPQEFAQFMTGAALVSPVTMEDVTAQSGPRKRTTRTIQMTSRTNGSPLGGRPSVPVATLTLTAVVYDSALACDSSTCVSYRCSIQRH